MVSVVMMRQEVENAVNQHTPRNDRHPLRTHQIIPDPQDNQNQRNGVEDIEEVLPRLHEIPKTPHFTLRGLEDEGLHGEKDKYRDVGYHGTEEGVRVEVRLPAF